MKKQLTFSQIKKQHVSRVPFSNSMLLYFIFNKGGYCYFALRNDHVASNLCKTQLIKNILTFHNYIYTANVFFSLKYDALLHSKQFYNFTIIWSKNFFSHVEYFLVVEPLMISRYRVIDIQPSQNFLDRNEDFW